MTKTTKRKIGEGVFWTSLSSAGVKVIGIIYVIVILSNLSVYEYGLIELALSIVPLLGILSLAGLQPVIIADLVTYKSQKATSEMGYLLGSFISLKVILAVFATGILLAATYFFKDQFSSEIIHMVQVLAFMFLAGPLRSITLILLNVAHEFKLLSIFKFTEELFRLVLVASMLYVYDGGPFEVVLAFVIIDFFLPVIFLPFTMKIKSNLLASKITQSSFFDPLYSVKLHAKWSVFQGALNLFGQNIRPWIVQFFLGTQAVGIYATATGLYQNVISLVPITTVLQPIVPEFSERKELLSKLLNAVVKYQILILLLVLGASTVLLPVLFDTFFPSYQAAYPLFLFLAAAFIPDTFSKVYESVFHAFKLQKNLFFANVFKLIMVLIILPVSILMFGLYGIAIELFLTQTVYAVNRYHVLKKNIAEYRFSFLQVFIFNEMDRLLIRKTFHFLMSNVKKIRSLTK